MLENARRRDLDGSVVEKKKSPAVFNVFIRAIRQNGGGFRHKVLGWVFSDVFRKGDLTGRPVPREFWRDPKVVGWDGIYAGVEGALEERGSYRG